MTNKKDFRRYVPTLAYPRVASFQGRDAYAHADAAPVNPLIQDLLFTPWERLYREPFKGVTSDGEVVPGLYSLAPSNAPVEAMVQAANRLIERLDDAQRRALCLPIDAREWRRWNNTEMYVYRYGLRLEELGVEPRDAVMAVIRASVSQPGFSKTRGVMRLNHFLGELTGNTRVLGEWSYNFTLFGTPALEAPWGWQFMGHHLALNCLAIGRQMVLSPTFMGAEPTYIDEGPHAGLRLFEDEERRGLALMTSLRGAQRDRAILYHSSVGGDLPDGRRHRADQLHLGGAMQDNRVVPYEGLPAREMDADQRRQLMRLIETYVDPLPDGPQKARLEEIDRHLRDTHFCWIGGTGEDDTFYYRIQSPVVMIEFDHHSGVYLTNELPARFHIHTLVRTPNGNDYGMDLLRLHYLRDHDPGIRPGVAGGPIHHHLHPHDRGHGADPDHDHDEHRVRPKNRPDGAK